MLDENIDIYIPSGNIIYNYDTGEKDHIIDYYFLHSLQHEYPVNIIDYENINIQDDDVCITSLPVPHQVKASAFRIDTPSASLVYSGDAVTEN